MVGWRAFVAVLLLAAPTAAGDWLQDGGDAQRTGWATSPGPPWDDVALDIDLHSADTRLHRLGPPLIVGESAFVLAFGGQMPIVGSFGDGGHRLVLWEVPLDGRSPEPLHEIVSFGPDGALAANATHVFLASSMTVTAWSITGKAVDWTVEHALGGMVTANFMARGQNCAQAAVMADRLAVACVQREAFGLAVVVVLSLLNLTTHTVEGTWTKTIGGQPPTSSTGLSDLTAAIDGSVPGSILTTIAGLALAERYAVVSVENHEPRVNTPGLPASGISPEFEQGWIWVVDLEATMETDRDAWTYTQGTSTLGSDATNLIPPALIADGSVFLKHNDLRRVPLEHEGGAISSGDLRSGFQDSNGDFGSGCTLVETDVACGFSGRAFRFTPNLSIVWTSDLRSGEKFAFGSWAYDGSRIYAMTQSASGQLGLAALDASDGRVLWVHQFAADPNVPPWGQFALGDGFAVMSLSAGHVVVLGGTEASPVVRMDLDSAYPKPGAVVHVDLAASQPGSGGPANAYAADWGDGSPMTWQANAALQHDYETAGDKHATFFVRNAANQTARMQQTFHVGQHDPAITIWNRPFDEEYQQTTFFVLGFILTGLIALFGIARAGRKRRRFEHELKILEEEHKRLADDAHDCDAMLSEARSRAKALFLEKRIEESHSAFLVGRVDELRRGLRLGAVEQKLKFLPYGMVLQLQRLLADARVDEWERDHLMTALEQERSLNDAQRREVRKLIDSWFARDVKI